MSKTNGNGKSAETPPKWSFDFGTIKAKERLEFASELAIAFDPVGHSKSVNDADKLLAKWMSRTVAAWPDGKDWTDVTIYDNLSLLEYKEAATAFLEQFQRVFGNAKQDGTPV